MDEIKQMNSFATGTNVGHEPTLALRSEKKKRRRVRKSTERGRETKIRGSMEKEERYSRERVEQREKFARSGRLSLSFILLSLSSFLDRMIYMESYLRPNVFIFNGQVSLFPPTKWIDR